MIKQVEVTSVPHPGTLSQHNRGKCGVISGGGGRDHRKTKESSVRAWFPAKSPRAMSVRTRFCGHTALENSVSQAKWDLRSPIIDKPVSLLRSFKI